MITTYYDPHAWPRRTAHGAQPSGTRTPCIAPCSPSAYCTDYSNGAQYRQSVHLLATSPRPCSNGFWCKFRCRGGRGFHGASASGAVASSGAGSGAGDATRSGAFGAGAGAGGAGAVDSTRNTADGAGSSASVSGAGKVGAGACLRPHLVRVRSLPRQSVYNVPCHCCV